MTQSRNIAVTAVMGLVVLTGIALGWFAPLDDFLRDLRFANASRPASGEIVYVEAEAAALSDIGRSARVRSTVAQAIDRLSETGVERMVLDLDLSWPGVPSHDQQLAQSFSAAGTVHIAAHWRGAADGAGLGADLPLQMFAERAPPLLFATFPDPDGKIRRTMARLPMGQGSIDSLATGLSPDRPVRAERFYIDYGIDLQSVPRVPLADILDPDRDLSFLAGKRLVLGLSPFWSRGNAVAPVGGAMPPGMIQLLAAESVVQERTLADMGRLPVVFLVLGLGALFVVLRPRVPLGQMLVGVLAYSCVLELVTLVLYTNSGLLLDTAAVHLAQLGFLLGAFGQEFDSRHRSFAHAAHERDSMRAILARIVADHFDGVVVVDRDRIIRAASRLAEDLIAPALPGRAVREVLPTPFQAALDAAFEAGSVMDQVTEVTITRSDGQPRLVEYVVTLSSMEQADAEQPDRVACLTFRDVTERRQVEERLSYLAAHDPMTGAASRMRFSEIASTLLETPEGRQRGVNVTIVGLTRIKAVNDTLGHACGDELLRQVVRRIEETGPVCVARLEGNGFGILRPGVVGAREAELYAEDVLERVTRPYDIAGHHAIIGASAGITDTARSGFSADTLISHASTALSIATDMPGHASVMFTPEMDARIKQKQDLEIALRAALERGEFVVHYQPLVDLVTGEVLGVEALTRWNHPELGCVSPALFIPAAEETGLILELGRWVLETACREVGSWPRPLRLSVNVSPFQFEYGDIVSDVRMALALSGFPPSRLDIEITESLLVSETSRFIQKLERLRRDGVGVALDDFGTGYSSLSYLGRLPVDKIKIDQSFVRGLPEDAEATAIIRAVLMISESLGKEVVAEGIETADQAWLLRVAGCGVGQGYHFGRPMPAAAMIGRLSADRDDKMTEAG